MSQKLINDLRNHAIQQRDDIVRVTIPQHFFGAAERAVNRLRDARRSNLSAG